MLPQSLRLIRMLRYLGLAISIAIFAIALNLTSVSPAAGPLQVAIAADPAQPDSLRQLQVGQEAYRLEQYAAAIAAWQPAVAALARQGDTFNQAVGLSNLALAHQQLGQWTEANAAITQSITSLQALTPAVPQARSRLAAAWTIQGSLQLAQGQTEAAIQSWQQAMTLFEAEQDEAGVMRSLINQSQAFRVAGLYHRAQATLAEVQQRVQQQPDSRLKAAGLLNLGDTLRLVGDLKPAQAALQQSLAIAQAVPAPTEAAAALVSLGNTTLALYQAAVSNREEMDDQTVALGSAALTYYQQATQATSDAGIRLKAGLNQLRLLIDLGRTDEAQTQLATVQTLLANWPANRTSIFAHINLAQRLLQLNQTPLAVRHLSTAVQQARALGDRRAESYALGYLGEQYEQTRQWREAQTLTEEALTLTSYAPDIAYRWQWQLGRLLRRQGNSVAAIAAYTQAVDTLHSLRNDLVATNLDLQFSFRESVEPVYRELVDLLLTPSGGDVSAANLKAARQVLESLQLAELDNFFKEACLTANPAQIDEIDPQAAVFYAIILPTRLEVVLSLPQQALRHYATPIPQPELEELVESMRRSLRRTSLRRNRLEIAQRFYDLLIRPAEAELAASGVKTLTFVLDGAMKNLPMAALYDGQQFLIEKYGLALTPGLQLLPSRPLQRQELQVLVGGLSESRQGFASLPGVQTEVAQIQAEIPTRVLLNQSFTRTALQQQVQATPSPVVHLATHGQFSSSAENTFILTWDSQIDVKELGELMQQRNEASRHPVELLVLSACQTAEGDRRAALGLAGVAVRSGARSTLATLWPVDDTSTALFMAQLYQAMARSQTTKAEAIRQAQLTLMQQPEFEHPFYWAPFVLVGNWL